MMNQLLSSVSKANIKNPEKVTLTLQGTTIHSMKELREHFNRDEIEAMVDNWREEWETQKEAWEAKTEQLKKEIMDFVNAKVNRFSRISEVVEEKDDFAKTPTHKIKRFLYNRSKDNDKPQREQPAGKPETK